MNSSCINIMQLSRVFLTMKNLASVYSEQQIILPILKISRVNLIFLWISSDRRILNWETGSTCIGSARIAKVELSLSNLPFEKIGDPTQHFTSPTGSIELHTNKCPLYHLKYMWHDRILESRWEIISSGRCSYICNYTASIHEKNILIKHLKWYIPRPGIGTFYTEIFNPETKIVTNDLFFFK